METQIQRWGDSLVLRIPEGVAADAGLSDESRVEIRLEDGRLVIDLVEKKLRLEDLLDGITPENLHGEVNTGDSVGDEVW